MSNFVFIQNSLPPPSYLTKSGTKYCIYLKRTPTISKNRLLPQISPQKDQNLYFYKTPPSSCFKKSGILYLF